MRKHSSPWLLAILCFLAVAKAQAQLIFTKAGGKGAYGDYGRATAASMHSPSGVTFDGNGNMYIADQNNNRIRKVDAATGIIATVAGNDSQGFSGDGGLAINASLKLPSRVAVDKNDNLYIADHRNHRIRKVDATTGVITTVAGTGTAGFSGDGGQATAASLNTPTGIAVDGNGNIYFADRTNRRIRRVDATTGVINTVAGDGTSGIAGEGGPATNASVSLPEGVFLDGKGNLYIAELSGHRIRRVDATTAIITTVAGNGTAGYSGDGGQATAASLNTPTDIVLDGSGNLFISDEVNHRIRRVDATTGIITTVAGTGTAGFSGDGGQATAAKINFPYGIALDANGNLYIGDASNRVRKVDAATGVITTVAGDGTIRYVGEGVAATEASLNAPKGMVLDDEGNLYFADILNNKIRKVDAATGIITTVAGNGVSSFSGDGGQATNASLYLPQSVALDGNGNLYIVDMLNHRIRKVDATTGVITTVAGTGTPGYSGDAGPAINASLNFPRDVAFDGNGNYYIPEGHRIRKVDAMTGIITTLAGSGTAGFSGDGGPATAALLNVTDGVAVHGNNLYVTESGNHRIRKVDLTTGIISTVAGNGVAGFSGDDGPATSASLKNPAGIDVDENGNLYVADNGNHRVRKVNSATGNITTIAGNGIQGFSGDGGVATEASFNFSEHVALDKHGNLYVSDVSNFRIRYICAASSIVSSPAFGVRTVYAIQNASVAFAENCAVQARLQPSGANPVEGEIADSVWVEAAVPTFNGKPYVQRHYGMTPTLNAATATATITLYFTQTEFAAYNAAPNHGPDLPFDAADATGNKANVRIIKRSGTSNDGTGLYGSYSGTTTIITPTSVVWDTNLNAWAVTFDVNGFSGFFVATAPLTTLPLTLVDFSARLQATDGVLNWKTANEQGVSLYEVERSVDARSFAKVGSVTATNASLGNAYSFIDKNIAALGSPVVYYRLKMVDKDGAFRYSRFMPVNIARRDAVVMLYPNPTRESTSLQVASARKETLRYSIVDATGRTLTTKSINVVEGNNTFTIKTSGLSAGTYTLILKGTESTKQLKFVKH